MRQFLITSLTLILCFDSLLARNGGMNLKVYEVEPLLCPQ